MAANLNRPADFIHKQTKEKVTTFLIPPSEFEKPVASQRKGLEQAKQQIQELIVENERLKLLQNQASNPTAGISFASSQNEYADELIKRQGGEIAELKSELMKYRQAYDQDAAGWERKFSLQEQEYQEDIKKLEKQMARKTDEFEERLSRMSHELQHTLEEAESEATSLKEKLENTRTNLNQRVNELEEELNAVQRERDSTVRDLQSDLRNKSSTVEEQAHQISKLKVYIGETEQAHKPAQVWKTEKETVDNKLKLSQAENQKLQSELELLDVRFKALNDILAVQEAELSKAKNDGLGKAKQHSLLVTRWREKVFSLLVQQKSSEIVYKNDLNNSNQKIRNLDDKLAESRSETEILKHSLTDKSAQLEMEKQNKERLQQELNQTHQVALCLDDQSKENMDSVKILTDFVERSSKKHEEMLKILEEKSSHLKVLCQRVSFASGRMEFLKCQFVRKTAITFSLNDDSKKSLSVSRADESVSRDSEEHLYQELEKVMRERDSLATQVRDDSTKWTHRMTETRTQYLSEISTLKKTLEDMEYDLQQKSKTCAQLTEELESLREDTKDKDDTIAQLQEELAKHMKGIESVLIDQRTKDDEEWNERLSEMERKLNESKREHAKAVVSLRQMERSHSRELERGQDLLKTTEEHFTRQLQHLQSRLMSTEKERNIMMATLRQEGLINKLKSDRGEPIQLTLETDEDFPSQDNKQNRLESQNQLSNERGTRLPQKEEEGKTEKLQNMKGQSEDNLKLLSAKQITEPVQNALEDLKSLTAAIFDDDDDDEDENQYNSHNDSV